MLLPYTADATKITFMKSNIIPIKCPWFPKLDKYNDASTVGGFYICINIIVYHKHTTSIILFCYVMIQYVTKSQHLYDQGFYLEYMLRNLGNSKIYVAIKWAELIS